METGEMLQKTRMHYVRLLEVTAIIAPLHSNAPNIAPLKNYSFFTEPKREPSKESRLLSRGTPRAAQQVP